VIECPAAPDGAGGPPWPGPGELRRGVLAVSVLCDIDVEPRDDGIVLPGPRRVHVGWAECRRALAGHDPGGSDGRDRLRRWLLARRWAAELGRDGLVAQLRPVGLPVDHVLHPGLDWVQERVLGGALDLGLGALGLDPADPDGVVVLAPPALCAEGIDGKAAWPAARARLEELGALAAALLLHDPQGRLRPVGECDVVTLLGARSLRQALAEAAGGMASAVVPMRRRGWTQLAMIDPAFGPAAAAATAAQERGFPRPMLITVDEVVVAASGGRPGLLALRQPGADGEPWGREVLKR